MLSTAISRRRLLSGALRGQPMALRPPWAKPDEPRFLEYCTRCDACVDACPARILRRGDGGYPEVDFREAGCTFCGACAGACASGALSRQTLERGEPWTLRARVAPHCLSLQGTACRSCGEHCESGAIRFQLHTGGIARPIVDSALCNGCGACVSCCPVQAPILSPCSGPPAGEPERPA